MHKLYVNDMHFHLWFASATSCQTYQTKKKDGCFGNRKLQKQEGTKFERSTSSFDQITDGINQAAGKAFFVELVLEEILDRLIQLLYVALKMSVLLHHLCVLNCGEASRKFMLLKI